MIDPAAIFAYDFGQLEQEYSTRDAILYALGVGLGCEPHDLPFLDERALVVLPTFGVTLCSPGMWLRDPRFGIAFTKLVHVAQDAEFLAPIPSHGKVLGTAQVTSLTDRGAGRGAVLVLERTISDAESGTRYCCLRQTLLLVGDGGFGGPLEPSRKPPPHDLKPIAEAHVTTSPRSALIYRLSGDWNPLHLDPAVAAQAGFARPILHGLASYAIAGLAVSRGTGRHPADVTRLSCRFSGVVFPGDRLTFEIFTDRDGAIHFSAYVGDRKVLDRGVIAWTDA